MTRPPGTFIQFVKENEVHSWFKDISNLIQNLFILLFITVENKLANNSTPLVN